MSRIRLQEQASPEDAPFLDDHPDEPIPESLPASASPLRSSRPWQTSDPKTVIILLSLVKFLIVLSGMLILMPMYRLIEDAFCHAHFDDDSPGFMEEMKCKVEEVQSGLAFLMGWMGLLSSICRMSCVCARVTWLTQPRPHRNISIRAASRPDRAKTRGFAIIRWHGHQFLPDATHAGSSQVYHAREPKLYARRLRSNPRWRRCSRPDVDTLCHGGGRQFRGDQVRKKSP